MESVTGELTRWEIAARQATKLDRTPGIQVWAATSPDERWIARRENGKFEIRPISGGEWKPLVSVGGGQQTAFTPDGNWLMYHDVEPLGKQSLFRVATGGGQPERLGDFPTAGGGFMWISPNGREIIADERVPAELWILENFEPAAPKQ
jgi:hypothetical protein